MCDRGQLSLVAIDTRAVASHRAGLLYSHGDTSSTSELLPYLEKSVVKDVFVESLDSRHCCLETTHNYIITIFDRACGLDVQIELWRLPSSSSVTCFSKLDLFVYGSVCLQF